MQIQDRPFQSRGKEGETVEQKQLEDCDNLDENFRDPIDRIDLRNLAQNRLLKLPSRREGRSQCYDVITYLKRVLTQRYLQRFPGPSCEVLKNHPQYCRIGISDLSLINLLTPFIQK